MLGLLFTAKAWAIEPFVVEDIRLEGLQRISAGTVFNYLPVEVGDRLDDASSAEAIRALFETGFFRDVRLERDGDVLVVFVAERPAIGSVDISGNKDISTEQLTEALRQEGLSEGRVFNRFLLDRVEQELNRQYFSRGKYAATIETTVTPLPRNRVAVSIDISEGRAARIHDINIVGNETFEEEDLLDEFELDTGNFLSFYTRSDQYSRQQLTADLETLRSYYLDRGYLNFNIASTQVSITPDKQDIYITINIEEGEQFTVKDVQIAGDLVLPEEDIAELIDVEKGATFSRRAVTESNTEIAERLGNEGYAFANINTIPDIDQENNEVALTFFVDPGQRVYVRRISIAGNTKTRDEVLRREFRQLEGATVSTEDIERSRVRLERLGFFERVDVETVPVPGTTDQVDVNFTVVERPSGNLLAGVGFSQEQGVIFSGSINQENFLGSGRRVSAAFNNSDVNRVYSLAYTNPYYTIDGVSRGFTLFSRETDAFRANLARFSTDTLGGFVNYGIPINEFDTFTIGLGYEGLDVLTNERTPQQFRDFITDNGDEYGSFKLTAGISRDKRDRFIFPTSGLFQSINLEVAAADLEYFKLSLRNQVLFPLTDDLTLSFNGELGYGDAYGNTTELPFFENFLAGGPRSVRGFEANTLGPRDDTPGLENDPLGGNLRVVGNVELLFPPPFYEDSETVRVSAFVDAGNVYGPDEEFDVETLRASAGLSLTWLSPLGGLSFSYAYPLNEEPDDDIEAFQFSLGTTF